MESSEIDGSGFWKGTSAIVTPPADFALPAVKSVPAIPDRFNSGQEALETILRLAWGFVDSGMKIQETKYTAQKNARPLREQRSTRFYGPLRVTFPCWV